MLALPELLAVLDRIAPLALAEEWDNVGLLVEPEPRPIRCVFLCVDLLEPVLDEAIAERAQAIVAYHPPLFHPLRRLVRGAPGTRVLLRAVEAGIAIHSPHTAIDAAPGGVNDWLADGLGSGLRRAIRPPNARIDLSPEKDGPPPVVGQGRQVLLDRPTDLDELCRRVKRHVGLRQLRIAPAPRHAAGEPVASVALCAGAGGSVLEGSSADLLLTGEMSHHAVLAANARGASVLLCEHTNTERGYLPRLRDRLERELPRGVRVRVSRIDRDPLEVR